MERAILGVTMRDRHRSTWIRAKIGVKVIVQVVKKQKGRWAGHVAKMKDNRWTKRITDWCPFNDKRSKKGPTLDGEKTEKFAGKTWQRLAQNRQLWKELGEAGLCSAVDLQRLMMNMINSVVYKSNKEL